MKSSEAKLIIGLGNPGAKYTGTRHNIGFEIIEAFAKPAQLKFKKDNKFSAQVANKDITIKYTKVRKVKIALSVEGENLPNEQNENIKTAENEIVYQKKSIKENCSKEIKIICALPQTFMNKSGTAVQQLVNYYKIPLENILVVHDDVSLDTGKLRPAFNRGAGGQHGIEDIIEKLGNKNFHRLKFGVGPDPGGDARNHYVLEKFPKEQASIISASVIEATKLIYAWLLQEDPQQVIDIKVVI